MLCTLLSFDIVSIWILMDVIRDHYMMRSMSNGMGCHGNDVYRSCLAMEKSNLYSLFYAIIQSYNDTDYNYSSCTDFEISYFKYFGSRLPFHYIKFRLLLLRSATQKENTDALNKT